MSLFDEIDEDCVRTPRKKMSCGNTKQQLVELAKLVPKTINADWECHGWMNEL